jgi:hypothetical protein
MISVKNLMSDQNIVNKIFLDEFTKLRTFLLEEFDTNWCNLSENEGLSNTPIFLSSPCVG